MEDKVLTVKDLIKELKEAEKEGFGDVEVLLSFDDEWNGFRRLWSSQITLVSNDNDDDPEELEGFPELKKCIILG